MTHDAQADISEQARERVRELIQKYVDKANPYDGEVEQTLDAIEEVYTEIWNPIAGRLYELGKQTRG